MKNKINLHEKKQGTALRELISLLVKEFNPLAIYQFGMRQNMSVNESVFMAGEVIETQHYYLLMIIASENNTEKEVQETVSQNPTAYTATILVHGLASVTEALSNQHEFFTRIIGEGELVHDKGGLLSLPCPVNRKVRHDLARTKSIAAHNIAMALGYVNAAGSSLEVANYNVCICLLHQALQQACMALLRVFLGYSPNTYRLGYLLNLVCCFNAELGQTFAASHNTDKLFNLLCQGYETRKYSDSLSIKETEAAKLQELVWCFVRLTNEFCDCKIKIDEAVC